MRPRAIVTLMMILLAAAAALLACATTGSIPLRHPAEVGNMPRCSECHEDAYMTMDHSADWAGRHGLYASQRRNVCGVCHEESFCADCHANKDELKPSDKFKDEPWRDSPHRGDYLTRYKVDGRLNPASCFGCHGRKDDWRCKSCHR